MSAIGWIAAGLGALFYLTMWRLTFRMWFNDFKDDWGWGTLVGGVFLSFILALFMGWVSLGKELDGAGRGLNREIALRIARVLAGESQQQKVDRLRREVVDRERRIRDLEREVGVA